MKTLNSIVVELEDLSAPEQPALRAALACATEHTKLYLFHSLYNRKLTDQDTDTGNVLEEARELVISRRQKQLDDLVSSCGPNAEGTLVWSDVGWQELIRFAVSHQCDLVISRSGHKSRWQRLRPHHDDWELIRHCPKPLLLVRDNSDARYQQILAAIDPLHADDKPASLDVEILKLAGMMAKQSNAGISVLNVVSPALSMPATSMEPVVTTPVMLDKTIQAHRNKVEELAAAVVPPVESIEVTAGRAADEIVKHAERCQADLVVMGAVSRARVKRLLIGNTAERVLDALLCDVLIAKPDNFDSRIPAIAALTTLAGSTI